MEKPSQEWANGLARRRAERLGLEVLDQEWSADGLEGVCGIVARDPSDGIVAFVDVSVAQAEPDARAIVMPAPRTNLAQMRQVAERWYVERGRDQDPGKARFDSVSIMVTGTGRALMRWAGRGLS